MKFVSSLTKVQCINLCDLANGSLLSSLLMLHALIIWINFHPKPLLGIWDFKERFTNMKFEMNITDRLF